MRILVYSERLAATIKQGWFRTGDEIAYYPNKVKKKGTGYYTLTFVLDPPFADDTLYLAYCYPYTYSDLQTYLKVRKAVYCDKRSVDADEKTPASSFETLWVFCFTVRFLNLGKQQSTAWFLLRKESLVAFSK
jgi:hypothetical protein